MAFRDKARGPLGWILGVVGGLVLLVGSFFAGMATADTTADSEQASVTEQQQEQQGQESESESESDAETRHERDGGGDKAEKDKADKPDKADKDKTDQGTETDPDTQEENSDGESAPDQGRNDGDRKVRDDEGDVRGDGDGPARDGMTEDGPGHGHGGRHHSDAPDAPDSQEQQDAQDGPEA